MIKLALTLLIPLFFTFKPASAESFNISSPHLPPLASKEKFEDLGNGIFVDIVMSIFQRAGHEGNFIFHPMKRSHISFENKQVAFMLTSKSAIKFINLEEDTLNIISLGHYFQYFYYFKSHIGKEVKFEKYEDLRQYSICLARGSYMTSIFEAHDIHIEKSNTSEGCAKKLAYRRNDLWAALALTANYYAKSLYPEKLGDFTHTAPTSRSSDEVLLISFKDNESASKVHAQLLKAYQIQKDNGTIMAIMQAYWKGEVPDEVLPEELRKQP